MLRHIKLSSNQRIAAVCSFSTLAVAGLIGGIYSLGAAAEGDTFDVNIPGTAILDDDTVMWSFGNNRNISLDFAVADDDPVISSTDNGKISYNDFNDFTSKFSATTAGDQCANNSSFLFNLDTLAVLQSKITIL